MKILGRLGAALLPPALALGLLQLFVDGRLSATLTFGGVTFLVIGAILIALRR